MELTWDFAKATANLLKHKVAFSVAHDFEWDKSVSFVDDCQDYGELRIISYGPIFGRLHCLVFTPRDEDNDTRHIISLRKANRREGKFYGQQRQRGEEDRG